MYYYRISDGCYDTFDEHILVSPTKFTIKEFAEIVNAAIKELSSEQKILYMSDVAKHLVEWHGFQLVSDHITVSIHDDGVNLRDHQIPDDVIRIHELENIKQFHNEFEHIDDLL